MNLNDLRMYKDLMKNYKRIIDKSVELYSRGIISFNEFLDKSTVYQEQYQRAQNKQQDIINSTAPFSEERLKLCQALFS